MPSLLGSYDKRSKTDRTRDQEGSKEAQFSRMIWTQTIFEILDFTLRPQMVGIESFSLTLRLREEVQENSGYTENSGNPLVLSLGVEGKEIPLFSGLIGRRVRISGYLKEDSWELESLQEERDQLRYQLENLLWTLEQSGTLIRSQVQKELAPD